jgi:double-stranded uracil-DNA glycosylase
MGPTDKAALPVLPDLLRPGLRLIVCGTAAGRASAARKAYYAGRGNRFWEVIHRVGLTPELLSPENCSRLLQHGIGLTDLAKDHFGTDASLPSGCFDAARLRAIVERYQPRVLAFNGKKAASELLGVATSGVLYGRHSEPIENTLIYVLPSTSRAATRYWALEPWQEMAKVLLPCFSNGP